MGLSRGSLVTFLTSLDPLARPSRREVVAGEPDAAASHRVEAEQRAQQLRPPSADEARSRKRASGSAEDEEARKAAKAAKKAAKRAAKDGQ